MKTSLDPEEMVHSLVSINVAVTVAKKQKNLASNCYYRCIFNAVMLFQQLASLYLALCLNEALEASSE